MKLCSVPISIILLVTAASAAAVVTSTSTNPLENHLLQLLELWRTGEIHNIESFPLALPSLKLITLPPIEGIYKEFGINLCYVTRELQVTGLEHFSIENLRVAESNLTTEIDVIIPNVTVFSENYNIKGRAYGIYTLTGSGNMWIKVNNIKLTAGIQLLPHGIGTQIEDMLLEFTVDNVKVDLVGSSWPINNVLSKNGVDLIAKHHDYVVEVTKEAITNLTSQYLSTVTPEELIKTISSLSSSTPIPTTNDIKPPRTIFGRIKDFIFNLF